MQLDVAHVLVQLAHVHVHAHMNNILETKNLKVTINNKVILYLDKEVCISEKDKVAILGDNGAGKTTLVNSILGEKNSSGEITKKFKKK